MRVEVAVGCGVCVAVGFGGVDVTDAEVAVGVVPSNAPVLPLHARLITAQVNKSNATAPAPSLWGFRSRRVCILPYPLNPRSAA